MIFNIIPITYLISLSILLTPITLLIIYQITIFNKEKLYMAKEKEKELYHANHYQIANIYINNLQWHLALRNLENDISKPEYLNNQWNAKYHNAAGFILERINYSKLAYKYYCKALKLDPKYMYAQKNMQYLATKKRI